MKDVLKEALNAVKPTLEEEKQVNDKIKAFLKELNSVLKGCRAVLGGSGAKDTWLKGSHDADVFVQFEYSKYKNKSAELSEILQNQLEKKFDIVRLHGSRDYFQVKEKDFVFEIVPVLKITRAEQSVNITDVSMLHASWVNKYKKYSDDMRLLKQFCKAQGVYGAESFIKGFSGYICEILIVYYKGFKKLMKKASKWEPQTIIDINKYYKTSNDILFNVNKSKTTGPLILVDPVQKTRNAAAAVGEEKHDIFVKACNQFLKNPSKKLFEVKEISEEDLKKKAGKNKLIFVKSESLPGKPDVSGSKLLKVFDFLNQKLNEKDFKVYDSGWKWDKEKYALFWFIVDKKNLDNYRLMEGPPNRAKIYVDFFKKKHKKTFVSKGKVWAREKREFKDAVKLTSALIKDEYVEDKVKSISVE